jgi:dihydrolipoamide dehydrogenase
MSNYDVVVIGGGPGGYVAAIRCGQLGLATALVDEWLGADGKPALGGTCLNVGCIPSKALLDSSHHYHNLAHLLPAHGINVEGASMDVATMLARKDKVVKTMNRGVAALLKKNKVDAYSGHGRLESGNRVTVARHDNGGEETLSAKNVIIASGSVPVDIPVAPVDGKRIVDNAGALAFDAVPERLGIIGAGVIGLELGSVWNRLGSEVVILEALEDFLAAADRQIARDALKAFKKQGLDIRLGALVTGAKAGKKGVAVKYEDSDGAKAVEVDRLVVAVGRRAHTEGLVGAGVALAMDDGGRIQVDDMCHTSIDSVYAIGDVVKGPMLAHKASEEGVAVAEHIAGHAAHIDHRTVPWVIYTHPEIAWVGDTEQQLDAEGIGYRAGSFPYRALGRAHGAGETDGFIKVLAHVDTDEILGVHIFGAQASELIAEAVTAMVFRASSEDLARTIHAHPTLSEAMHEAALAVDGRAIHI